MAPWLGLLAVKDRSELCSYMAGMVSWLFDRLPNFFGKRVACTMFSQLWTYLEFWTKTLKLLKHVALLLNRTKHDMFYKELIFISGFNGNIIFFENGNGIFFSNKGCGNLQTINRESNTYKDHRNSTN